MVEWWRRQNVGHIPKTLLESPQKEALERLTGRMPLLLRGLEHILAKLDPEEQTKQLVQTVHAKLVELPEVVMFVGAINRYASAKVEEFAISENDEARAR